MKDKLKDNKRDTAKELYDRDFKALSRKDKIKQLQWELKEAKNDGDVVLSSKILEELKKLGYTNKKKKWVISMPSKYTVISIILIITLISFLLYLDKVVGLF